MSFRGHLERRSVVARPHSRVRLTLDFYIDLSPFGRWVRCLTTEGGVDRGTMHRQVFSVHQVNLAL